MCVSRLVSSAAAIVLAAWLSATASQPSPALAACGFPPPSVAWIQRALDGWQHVARASLGIPSPRLAPIVFFDGSCAWHLAPDDGQAARGRRLSDVLTFDGRDVPVTAIAHGGTVLLPNGSTVAVTSKASTALYRTDSEAFVAMAMPSVWKTKTMSAQTLGEYLRGAFCHEMTHTLLLAPVNRRVRELAQTHDLVYPINDDVIQAQFQRLPGFEAAFNRERDALYRAVAEPDHAKRRALAIKALDLVRARRARYYTGESAAYAELESLFLTMEGVGQWAAYQLALTRAGGSEAEALKLVRDNRKYWSQDEGLALFLLVDALIPNWQPRIFNAPLPPSPIELLTEWAARPPM